MDNKTKRLNEEFTVICITRDDILMERRITEEQALAITNDEMQVIARKLYDIYTYDIYSSRLYTEVYNEVMQK